MSNNNDNARWVKNGNVHTQDDFKFKIFRRKNDTNILMTNDFESAIDSQSKLSMNETIKSGDGAQEKWQHTTVGNSSKLNFAKLYSNPFKNTHLNQPIINSTEVEANRFNVTLPIENEIDNSNDNRPNFKNNLSISDSWRVKNDDNKVKDAWLSYVNSPNHITLPFINLQTIANPYVQIPIKPRKSSAPQILFVNEFID